MSNPTAARLISGNEILSGRVQDANLNYLARRLADCGIDLLEVRVVRDQKKRLVTALNDLRTGYDYLFTSGGIGPTHDDITMPCVAEALGVPLERNAEVSEKLKLLLAGRATDATFRMADFPQGARLVPNTETTAPGCIAQNIIVCAGIPRIFQAMVEAALPLLQRGEPIHTRSVDVWLSESQISKGLERIQQHYAGVDVGSYPYRIEGRNGTALVARGTDVGEVEAAYGAIQAMIDELDGERR